MTVEEQLLEQAKVYDPGALSELYDRYAPRMYAYIYRRVGDAHVAEDLTGELFVRVLRAIQDERVWRNSFGAWLHRIAHNLVIDHYRRQPPAPHSALDESWLPSAETGPPEAVERTLAREQLMQAIRLLTPEQQEVIALRFGEGMATKEVAEIMDKTVGAVEGLQRRATAALRRILAQRESV